MPVTLAKHIDGDTSQFFLHDEKIKVRYLLIDTPETVKPNTALQPYRYEASERTKHLLIQAKKIEIELDEGEQTDHYGRDLAYVFVDDKLIQDILVHEGLARVAYVKKPSTRYLFQLKLSQQKAQIGKKEFGQRRDT